MAKKKVFLIVGACVVIVAIAVGIVLLVKHNDTKPVNNKVSTRNTSSDLSVGSASSTNGIQQAGGDSNTSSSVNDTKSEIESMTDPSTFSKYNAPKYKDATTAYYVNLQNGTGAMLSKPGQKAVIIYRGWLTNGTLFDETKVNSKNQNEAFEFTYESNPEQVIKGMDEGMTGMKVGGIRLLIIPPAAGYGATSRSSIPANSVLIFEVQLEEIQ